MGNGDSNKNKKIKINKIKHLYTRVVNAFFLCVKISRQLYLLTMFFKMDETHKLCSVILH